VYCDFAVTVRRQGDLAGWKEALSVELDLVEREGLFVLAPELDSLYVGGGTPSLLGPGAMQAIGGILGRERVCGADVEWTAEANPETFTPDVAEAWAEAGVNRLSLGAQTFHEGALRWMGRLHGADGPEMAVRAARDVGLENVSVDLIFGLPAHVGRSWGDDLQRVVDLDVPHVSLYGLTVESATAFGRAVAQGWEAPVDEGQYEEEFLLAADVLSGAGYDHYEVSNFARPGAQARHNAVYWRGGTYLGLGNGAHSYAHPVRRWNVRDWETYRRRLLAGEPAEAGREVIDDAAAELERTWLGLRTTQGLDVRPDRSAARALTDRWMTRGLATASGDTVRLTPRGWLQLDRLTVELDGALQRGLTSDPDPFDLG
jgi:oxygen-independent coproporphyrinogen-3 oxidase